MTKKELIRIKDILTWAQNKIMTDGMYQEIRDMTKIVDKELKEKKDDDN